MEIDSPAPELTLRLLIIDTLMLERTSPNDMTFFTGRSTLRVIV